MAKTIKNTKNKQKSTKSQKPTFEPITKWLIRLAQQSQKDFEYHESMREIQDEYIESNFKAIRWFYIVLCALVVLLSVCTSIRTNKIETRLTQLEATYEISRRD